MSNIKILVAHHKPGFIFEDDRIMPIQVGRAVSTHDLPMQSDSTGDNISELNPYYCEMTAIYWAWKNLPDTEYIGLFHYRRYLTDKTYVFNLLSTLKFAVNRSIGAVFKRYKRGGSKDHYTFKELHRFERKLQISSGFIQDVLENKNYDLLISLKFSHANVSNREHFSKTIGEEYLETQSEIIAKTFPDFSIIYEREMSARYLYHGNIFVMKKEYFEEYCAIIFPILNMHYEKYKDMPEKSSRYSRIPGYLSELITNAYIHSLIQKGVKYKCLAIGFLSE